MAVLPSLVHAQSSDDIRSLGWMAGCWELRSGARVAHEQWMAPLGGLMMGMSRTVVGDVVREYETTRIEVVNGELTYRAQPSGQAAASFAAVTVSDSLVVFANPEHDFPQRIQYRRAARGDSLIARVEGTRAGTTRGIDFPMKRIACAPGAGSSRDF